MPHTDVLSSVGPLKDTVTLLRILVVVATVSSIVWPLETSTPVLPSLRETALVETTISVLQVTLSMHPIHFPVSCIYASFYCPSIRAVAVEFVVEDFALVSGPIRPAEQAFASLLAPLEFSNVLRPIGPLLLTLSMLQIVDPVALVPYTFHACEGTVSILPAIDPIPFVDASIGVDHSSSAICFVVVPKSFKDALVIPYNGTASLPLACLYVTLSMVLLTFAKDYSAELELFLRLIKL